MERPARIAALTLAGLLTRAPALYGAGRDLEADTGGEVTGPEYLVGHWDTGPPFRVVRATPPNHPAEPPRGTTPRCTPG